MANKPTMTYVPTVVPKDPLSIGKFKERKYLT